MKKPLEFLFDCVSTDCKLSNTTVSYYHHVISSILSTAVQWQIIPANPAERVKPPKIKKKEAIYLDEADCIKLIEALDSEQILYKTLILMVLYTGMRRGEVLGLTWDDIDFKNNKIDISKTRLYIHGLGVIDDTPKNETSKRVIGLSAHIACVLREYQKYQSNNRELCGDIWPNNNLIFTGVRGNPLHPDTVSSWFSNFVKRHNLPPVHLHSLRHTNASLLIANGVDIKTVSTRLGHANVQTTGVIYTHQIKSADSKATEMLENILQVKKDTT